jgi:outer membrane protein W
MKFLTAAATLLLIAAPLAARDRGPEVAAWYVWMQPGAEGTFNAGDPAEPFDVDLSGDTGYGVSGTLFLGNRVSAEVGVSQVKTSIELDELDSETRRQRRTSTIMPITATLQYHFAPNAMIDPYIGVGAAHILLGKIDELDDSDDEEDLSVADIDSAGTNYLVNFGLSIELTETFGALIDAKYIPGGSKARARLNDAAATESEIEFAPIIVSIGFSYRF